MKKIILTLAIASLFCGIKACANIAAPNVANTNPEQQMSQDLASELNKFMSPEDLAKNFMNGYFSYLRECKPYDINFGFNVIDLGMQTQLKVDGWVEEKCVYNVSGKITHLSDNIRNMFNVKMQDAELAKIEPVFQCKFSKTQLDKIIDILEEETMNEMKKDVYSPAQQDIEKKHQGEIIKILSSAGTCEFLNADEIMKNFMPKEN